MKLRISHDIKSLHKCKIVVLVNINKRIILYKEKISKNHVTSHKSLDFNNKVDFEILISELDVSVDFA